MKNEKAAAKPVQIVFTSRSWAVFSGNRVIAIANSGQQLVNWANMFGWSISNRDNLVPSLSSQLVY